MVMGQFGGIHRWCPQRLMGRLPDGVCKVVSGTVPLLNSEPWLLCFQPLLALQLCRSPLYSERGEKCVSSGVSHRVAEAGHSLTCSHFPLQETSQAMRVSLGTELLRMR